MRMLRVFAFSTALLTVFSLAGCGTVSKIYNPPGKLDTVFEASAKLNPDPKGRPSPLVLRLYELKSEQNFNRAEFFALYDQDDTTLGQDLIAREEFKLAPGEHRPYERKLNEQTRFIGIIAAYRSITKAQWRVVIPAPKGDKIKNKIILDSLAVSVAKPE